MKAVEEFFYFKTPTYLYSQKDSKSLLGSNITRPAREILNISRYTTGSQAFKNNIQDIDIINEGYQLGEWINGDQDKSPFKEKEILAVKNNLVSLSKRFSFKTTSQTLVRLVLLINSYVNQLSFFLKYSRYRLITIPGWTPIVLVAKIYRGTQKIFSRIEKIYHTKKNNRTYQNYGALLSEITSSVISLTSLIASLFFLQISPAERIILSFFSFFGFLLQNAINYKTYKTNHLDQWSKEHPTIMIK